MTQVPVLSCRDVVVEYPGHPPVRAVRGVSFELFPGEVVGLVGESGCGKSTMAKVLTGLLRPDEGVVLYEGAPLPPLGLGGRPVHLTGVQMVFQDPGSSLNPRRRVGAQIADGLATGAARRRWRLSKSGPAAEPHPAEPQAARPATAEAWLARVGMEARDVNRYPGSFSGGQRQRIATARALAAEPTVLIGDEPISALDASTQAKVAHLMSRLAVEQGTALLFISHDLSVVRLIADRLLVMYKGRIVERGPTEAIWNDPLHPYTKSLLGAIPVPDGAGKLPQATEPGTEYPLDEAVRPDARGREPE
ncbi:MAG: ATP-binding cassette domain-containing protein [Propionibacteriaceae bacterium]|jgi:peptide/nickel transport system ATP-binding protein|nr:ATP-binding cassette domain-containing protein [Propionibacteriaceae bacterium]